MKPTTEQEKEQRRLASPHPEDRFTAEEEDALYHVNADAMLKKLREKKKLIKA